MSGTGVAVAREGGEVAERAERFDPIAYLLHALNQPLTGLQCSLELAAAGTRSEEQFRKTCMDGLELTARMRLLVAALREVNGIEHEQALQPTAIRLDELVKETIEDLRPVAESRQLRVAASGAGAGRACRVQREVASGIFRLFDSALALSAAGSTLRVHVDSQARQAALSVAWMGPGPANQAERLALSTPELGLLMARTIWQKAGGEWRVENSGKDRALRLRMPWVEEVEEKEAENDPARFLSGGGR